MASKTRIQKILDPTWIGTWRIVRRPPIGDKPVIQGKPRERLSNAWKDFQQKEGIRLRKALNAMTHGKTIFAYHNLRTNQVVYSLTRYLEVGLISIRAAPSRRLLILYLTWLFVVLCCRKTTC